MLVLLSLPHNETTIEKVKEIFGTLDQIVSDNVPGFTNQELKCFMNQNGIMHTLILLYQPSSNVLAECTVKTVKQSISILEVSTSHTITTFLSNYCISSDKYRNFTI